METSIIKPELSIIQSKIYEIRNVKVMLDFDLAEIYGVETKRLKEQVRRNINRFSGDDFMFQLTKTELFECSRSQFATLNSGRGSNIKYLPFAFTELGVAMLSSVLNSDKAIEVNKEIIRTFVMLRRYALGYAELNQKLEEFMHKTDVKFDEIYQIFDEFARHKKELEQPRRPIGYVQQNRKN